MKKCISFFLILCVAGCGGGSKKIPLPFKDAKWEVRTGTHEKKSLDIRLNQTLMNFVGSLKHEATVSVSLKQPLPDGLAGEDEAPVLKKIENALAEKLDQTGLAVFAMVIQMDKKCDYVFFTNKPGAVKKAIREMGNKIEDYQLALKMTRDDNWTNYKYFYSFVVSKGWN
jgi:hypothetical protein